jgi:hypothetical protein
MLGEWGGRLWLMQFMNLYENRTMRPVEVVLSRGKEIRENDVGGK